MGTFVFLCVVVFIGWLVSKVCGGICGLIGMLFVLCEYALGGAIIGAGVCFLFTFSWSAATTGAIIGAIIGAFCTFKQVVRLVKNL